MIKDDRQNSGSHNTGNQNAGNQNAGDRNPGNGNSGDQNSGNQNAGNWNTGNWNTGDQNTGDRNTGYWNTGNWNTGNWNTGGRNTGYNNAGGRNTGDQNSGNQSTGNQNTGDRNAGHRNAGDRNTGNENTGNGNTGHLNTGNCNAGNCNAGNCNTGHWNTGHWNTGDFNSCNYSSGVFMSRRISYEAFNKSLTKDEFEELVSSAGYNICRGFRLVRISIKNKETKFRRVEHIGYKASWKVFWNNLSFKQRAAVRRMPFFDEKVFFEITGIQLRSGKERNETGEVGNIHDNPELLEGIKVNKKEIKKMEMKIYISGKISGDINYQNKFEDAADLLAKAGYMPINPVHHVRSDDKDNWHAAMKTVLNVMLCCDGIALLPDWADSKGAKIEEGLACEFGIPVKTIKQWIKEKE